MVFLHSGAQGNIHTMPVRVPNRYRDHAVVCHQALRQTRGTLDGQMPTRVGI